MEQLGDEFVIVKIEGCSSVIGYKACINKVLKLFKENGDTQEAEEELAKKIKSEVKSMQCSKDYDLGDFTKAMIIKQTSPTLLRLVSKLVSDGSNTKESISLSQAIQAQIDKRPNQTTLGLGIKLHHKYGSRLLLDELSSHAFTAKYDEVLRFRKSAGKFARDNADMLHQLLGLTSRTGIIFGWFDNLDLFLSTPNGRRETHVMAHEFQVHPAGIIEAGHARPKLSYVKIPRLNYTELKQNKQDFKPAIQLKHYAGPKRVNPPQPKRNPHQGPSLEDVFAKEKSLKAAQDKDAEWLNSLMGDKTIEWNGFNTVVARESGLPPHPASIYLIGHLLDSPPAHPDTCNTSLQYMKKSMEDMGMKYIHISMDMQLFISSIHICWHNFLKYNNVILHPGGMHIIMSFVGGISRLMEGSGLEVYISAAYGGLTSIFNGKSWVKALRAYRSVAAALLHNFLSTGQKTFEQIDEYINEARTRDTGRHWVDNFLEPLLIVHQFERAEREGDFLLRLLSMKRMLRIFRVTQRIDYFRYILQHTIDMDDLAEDAVEDLKSGAFVCRHQPGHWNAVSGDQFGEQTAIKTGKASLKGATLQPELVSEWVDAFPFTAMVTDLFKNMYEEEDDGNESDDSICTKHKEEMPARRHLD